MKRMILKNYMLTTFRLMLAKWWLSLIKLFSLSSGILSFFLVWLFYRDQHFLLGESDDLLLSCTPDNILLLGGILVITTVIYFLVVKSQLSFRQKELFVRKLYGESNLGVIIILMIETAIFIILSVLLSFILIDQVAPLFNEITNKDVNFREFAKIKDLSMITFFLLLLGVLIGIIPSFWYAHNRAIDILKKLPKEVTRERIEKD